MEIAAIPVEIAAILVEIVAIRPRLGPISTGIAAISMRIVMILVGMGTIPTGITPISMGIAAILMRIAAIPVEIAAKSASTATKGAAPMAVKVRLNLKNYTIPEKVEFARRIVTAMTGNARFATPTPALVNVTVAAAQLESAYNEAQAARQAAQQKTQAQNQREQALDLVLGQIGNYVEIAAGGDPAVVQSAGMDVRDSNAARVGALPAPEGLRADMGDHEGEINLVWDRLRGASVYVVQTSPDPEKGEWRQAALSTASRATVEGLASGQVHYFRVAGVGSAGQGPWSDVAAKMAP